MDGLPQRKAKITFRTDIQIRVYPTLGLLKQIDSSSQFVERF
eukprot:UN19380